MASLTELRKAASRVPATVAISEAVSELEHSIIHEPSVSQLLELTSDNKLTVRQRLLAILAGLQKAGNIDPISDQALEIDLAASIAKLIAPVSKSTKAPTESLLLDPGDTEEDEYRELAARLRLDGPAGLRALEQIARKGASSVKFDTQSLLTILAFTDPADPWTDGEAAGIAAQLADLQITQLQPDFIAEAILRDFLRPLFSKSRPATVTASGRKAEYVDDSDRYRGLNNETRSTKPWKYADHRSLPVLAWAVEAADDALLSKQWHMFIPVLLTLLDDPAPRIRSRGLSIVASFLQKLPQKVLRDTGLASVFEQAILPILLLLPNMTPEKESLQVLDPAFNALLALSRKLGSGQDSMEKHKMLDNVLREGAFAAYFHAKDHVKIVEVVVRQTGSIVTEMGIHAVKHLKDLIPIFSAIMTDPFAMSAPATLTSAIKALQATLSACWPRISRPLWLDEILKALVLCWLNGEEGEDLKSVQEADKRTIQQELIKAANMLKAIAEAAGVDIAAQIEALVSAEPSLRQLLAS